MSDAEPAEAEAKPKKKKKGGVLSRAGSPTQWFSAAGCASVLTGVFLLLLVIGVWVVFVLDPNNIPWRHSMSWLRIAIELLLVAVIPVALYWAIKIWLEGDRSAYPDIDFAWQAGLDGLQRNGLSLSGVPVFVVIGSSGARQSDALVRAANQEWRVTQTPEGPAAIHWYAGPDGVYLFLSEVGRLSALAALSEKRNRPLDEVGSPLDIPLPNLPAPTTARAAQRAPKRGDNRGTIMLDRFVADMQTEAQPQASVVEEEVNEAEPANMRSTAGADQPATLSPQEAARQSDRVEYLCQLLRRARGSICPINGVLTLLPFELLEASARETEELQRSVRADLVNLQDHLEVRCPTTALVTGMQKDRGFREIVRRVGRERAAAQRFGRRFDVRMIAGPVQMTSLCSHVNGVFEDWIHALFREAGALSRPGNARLYSLLCKVRSNLTGVLGDVLASGFGFDPQQRDLREPVAFSGCYFAATGETEDQQAFVRGVFEKLLEEQEDVEWSRTASLRNFRYQGLAVLLVVATFVVFVTLVSVVLFRLLS